MKRENDGFDATTLRVPDGDAWAELRRTPDGRTELEVRDALHHWLRPVEDALEMMPSAEGWFLGGQLPEGASDVELVTTTDRCPVKVAMGLWLGSLPREHASVAREVVFLGADGRKIDGRALGDLEILRYRVGVLSPEFAPERAPVMLHPSRRWRDLGWLLGCVAFVVLGAVEAALGQAIGWLVVAFFGGLAAFWICWIVLGWGRLRLDSDGFGWGGVFRKRYEWREVQAFVPVGEAVGFILRGPAATRKGARLQRAFTGGAARRAARNVRIQAIPARRAYECMVASLRAQRRARSRRVGSRGSGPVERGRASRGPSPG